jgi:uncharacterized protein (TIGR02231 family)
MRRCWFALSFAIALSAIALPISAAEIEAASRIDGVTVYPDGATVTRVIRLDLPAGDTTLLARNFPTTLDPSSLRIEGEANARLVIGSVDARTPRPAPPANLPEIDKRSEMLRDQRAVLDGAIAAATARRKFAERFAEASPAGIGEKGEARPLTEWRAAFLAIAEEVAAADNAIRDSRIKQRDIDRDLARLEAERNATPPQKLEVRVDLNAVAATPALLRVTYAVRGARWIPAYDARLETGSKDRQPALELLRRAEIVQATGEDWNDVALTVSTMRVARGGSAPELPTLIVRYPGAPPRPLAASAPAPGAEADQLRAGAGRLQDGSARMKIEQQEAVVESGGFQVLFRVPGRITVVAGQGAKSFQLASANLSPVLKILAAPALSETAFLQANFKHAEDAPLLPGRVSLYRDGVFVGRSPLPLIAKEEIVRLGFGADEKIKVVRTVVRKIEGTAGLIGSSKTDEREFKTTIRNGHDVPIQVSIEDQVPVSEIEEIQVEMLPQTTPPTTRDVRDRRGVLEWAFEAQPGETREIKLGWRVRWPKEKALQYAPRMP